MAAYPGNTTPQNSDDQQLTLKKILLALIGGGGGIPVVPSGGGGGTPVTTITSPTPVAVTDTSGTVLAANTSRKNVTIVNYGANSVTLFEGTPAIFGRGVYLNAGGGTYNMGADYLYTGIITAICASTLSSTLAVVERQ